MKIPSLRSFFYVRRPVPHSRSRKLYLAHKEAARALITERVAYLNQHYKLPVGKISIRNQKSRWGSCSKSGNLNFNYRLVFLSPELRDYVIVHEICHIKEFNHGRGFWDLVAETVPDYRKCRIDLHRMRI